jgi:hypothetical protein
MKQRLKVLSVRNKTLPGFSSRQSLAAAAEFVEAIVVAEALRPVGLGQSIEF